MFALKTKDKPLKDEIVRLQKKLSESQASMRDIQQVLEMTEDGGYVISRLRTMFGLPVLEHEKRASQLMDQGGYGGQVVRRTTGNNSRTWGQSRLAMLLLGGLKSLCGRGSFFWRTRTSTQVCYVSSITVYQQRSCCSG